ncbi:MAG: non-heme iron oxygenase ferredoxin subunit [Anaerolineales bacterium]|nr:non-heme iron oxygenase ferredoxin subunit [Anaerolineales bacterium]
MVDFTGSDFPEGWMYNYKTYTEEDVEFVSVASEDELGNGQRILLEIDGQAIALFNIAGELFAIADVCSHDDGPLAEGELEAYEIECPRHGAHFDLRTGKVLTLPAVVDIPAYPVRVVEGDVLIGLPLEE